MIQVGCRQDPLVGEILLRQIRVEDCDCHHIEFSIIAKISRIA